MATERFANSAQTTLASAVNSSATTLGVTSAVGFPSAGNFRIRIDNELLIVTAVSGLTWTVTRGAETTGAADHTAGAVATQVLTAAAMNALAAVSADQSANTVLAGPASGGSTAPAFRALAAADLPAASDTAPGAIEVADQSEMEGASATNRAVTPGRVRYSPFAAKAWVYFTVSGTTVTVQASAGVSGVARNAAGDYTVTWSTAFSSANYCVAVTAGGSGVIAAVTANSAPLTATTARVLSVGTSFIPFETTFMHVVAYGDQ